MNMIGSIVFALIAATFVVDCAQGAKVLRGANDVLSNEAFWDRELSMSMSMSMKSLKGKKAPKAGKKRRQLSVSEQEIAFWDSAERDLSMSMSMSMKSPKGKKASKEGKKRRKLSVSQN